MSKQKSMRLSFFFFARFLIAWLDEICGMLKKDKESTDRKLLFSWTIEMVHGFLVDVNVRILECLANVSGSNRGNLWSFNRFCLFRWFKAIPNSQLFISSNSCNLLATWWCYHTKNSSVMTIQILEIVLGRL